jgi:O-antigen ligase
MRQAALAMAPSTPLARARRLLPRLALAGALAHALFLPISLAGMQIGLGVALGALVLLRLQGRRVWARSALDLPALLLCAAAVLSLPLGALAGSPPVGWHEATLWRSLLAPLVVLSALEVEGAARGEDAGRSRRAALLALGVWAAASFLPSAVAWAQYFTGFDPLYALGLRREPVRAVVPVFQGGYAAVGFFRWYQRLAHNLLPPLCVAAALALHGGLSRRWRVLLGGAALAASAAVVLTLSRSAWAGLVGAAVLILLLAPAARRWALPAALALSLAMALHPAVRLRVSNLVSMPGINDDRKSIWTVCRAVIEDHPLTGVGFGNLPQRSIPYYDKLAPWHPLRAWCHDSFMTAWAEGGPLLFAALVAWWALLARAFWRWRARADRLGQAAAIGALAALAAMAGNALFHDVLYSSEAMYGLGFALAVAAALARSGARVAAPRSRDGLSSPGELRARGAGSR